jgi:hypothetical protein
MTEPVAYRIVESRWTILLISPAGRYAKANRAMMIIPGSPGDRQWDDFSSLRVTHGCSVSAIIFRSGIKDVTAFVAALTKAIVS